MGHSGSTLLSLLLGVREQMAAVGEIDKIIHRGSRGTYMKRYIIREKYPCSCGELPSDCVFWSDLSDYIKTHPEKDYAGCYGKAAELVRNRLSSRFMIDASKNIHALKRVHGALPKVKNKTSLKVLHLVKDVRNLSVSNMRSGVRESGTLQNFRKWKKQNRAFEAFVSDHNIPYMNIGYEELAISTEFVLKKIDSFLGVREPRVKTGLQPQKSHILFGNNMRLNEDHVSKIEYDYQWFVNSKVALCYSFSPVIQRLNRKWVYSNVSHQFKSNRSYSPPTT